jgi:hypothetical protein
MALLEVMIAMFLGIVILSSMLITSGSVGQASVAIMNYTELNKNSRNTLDVMSRDFRTTAVVSALSPSSVTVTNTLSGDTISYTWDGTNDFTRTFNGVSTVMLTGCDTLIFNGYQRNPTTNLQFVVASTAAETKLISVSWRCSRTILGIKLNTESVQTAQICIRN